MECESSGAGAIVLPSLFEEQVIAWNENRHRVDEPPPHADLETGFGHDAWTYLSFVNRSSVQSGIPVLASINGNRADKWIDFACELEEAGASGIELNLYHSPMQECSDPRELENRVIDSVSAIRDAVMIPVFVKLCRHYTSVPDLVRRLKGRASGVVLFGRQPDLEICLDQITFRSQWDLTAGGSISQSLGWIMQTHLFCPEMPIAANGGIGSSVDALRSLLAGADVAMITSVIYREGPRVIESCLNGLRSFMKTHQLLSMKELYTHRPIDFPSEQDRAAYAAALTRRARLGDDLARAQH